MPINVTQESYDKVKSIPPPQRRVKRPRLDKSVASGGDSDQENTLENVEVTNLDPPSGDKRPMVLFSHVMKQSELAKVSCLMNYIAYPVLFVKGKAIPLQTWTGPEGFRSLRLPDFKTVGT